MPQRQRAEGAPEGAARPRARLGQGHVAPDLAAPQRPFLPWGVEVEAEALPGMPSQETMTDAVGMLTGMHDADLTVVTGRNSLNVINHLQDLGTRSIWSPVDPRVEQAAQRAGDDPEQLVRNLLALVTADPPVLSNRPGSSVQPADPAVAPDRITARPGDAGSSTSVRPSMPSTAVLGDAVAIVGAMHAQRAQIAGLTNHHLSRVTALLGDIASLPPSALPADVRRAAQQARDNPADLVRHLLALVTENSPVQASRPHAAPLGPSGPLHAGMAGPSPRMPSERVMSQAIDIINAGMPGVTHRNMADVLALVQDILTLPPWHLRPSVLQAAERASNDPRQLVQNLLALVTTHPPEPLGPGSWSEPPPWAGPPFGDRASRW